MPVSIARALVMGGALALSAGGAIAQGQKQTAAGQAGRIASQPAYDVGAAKRQIPPVLAAASAAPYGPKGTASCAQIAAGLKELNGALGPDYRPQNIAEKENRAGKFAQAGGKSVINSIIPFRGLVREATGAAPAQRRLEAAVDAGLARRGFLRGLQLARRCKAVD
ncbi:hypothetical protein PQ455_17385 [Sphingomonas naphthae]|uniref:Uncharacterized protein n=1 Tax=Sphingomonas naphthae TaxID=1813468 RepID=A0ABY7TK88_9SPHN|nr:hypothetical protein [Sphingomonas naphthae]WCT73358.1 hypothetical protein PQ455_17385 [Sphingomonas naphthae]